MRGTNELQMICYEKSNTFVMIKMTLQNRRFLLLFLILIVCDIHVIGQISLQKPLLWDLKTIELIEKEEHHKTFKQIIDISNQYCSLKPVSVTDKISSFNDDFHYYCSVAGYWWRDSTDNGNYIRRDGVRNPLYKEYDAPRLVEFKKRCVYLSVAYFITGEQKYLNAYNKQISAWFIDKQTFMYPNFIYASVIQGRNGNFGRSSGMIQAYSFIEILESVRLVNMKGGLKEAELLEIRNWFEKFVSWSEGGRTGKSLRKANNNVGLAYDVLLVYIYNFIGEYKKAELIKNKFADKRLLTQVDEEGKQESELKRTLAFTYSLFNLTHVLDFCYLTQSIGDNFYSKYNKRIDKGFEFLSHYANVPESFPYQQISKWRESIKDLRFQELRLKKLKGKSVDVFNNYKEPVDLFLLLNL